MRSHFERSRQRTGLLRTIVVAVFVFAASERSRYGSLGLLGSPNAAQEMRVPERQGMPGWESSPGAPAPTAPMRLEAVKRDPVGNWKYVGVSSCAAANCHGGATREPFPYRSSYSVWVQRDKHANAYLVLFGDRSKKICRRLGFDVEDSEKLSRCLDCHTINAHASERRRTFTLEDGVSCEACHGPASGWLDEHSRDPWRSLSGEQKERYGMTNLADDLGKRATICVDCHVGSNQKDVNHDLIAAGHPRLSFEFAAYHGMIPPHWEVPKDQARVESRLGGPARASFGVQLWVVGQLVTARAAASLLKARAQSAVETSAGRPSGSSIPLWRKRAWPELAEYDCFACHHSLVANSWRREARRTDAVWGRGRSRKPGFPRSDSWYFSQLGLIADELEQDQQGSLRRLLAGLNEAMSTLSSSPQNAEKVKQAATALQASLDEVIGLHVRPDRPVFGNQPQRLKPLLARVTSLPTDTVIEWDDLAQAYLAARALEGARGAVTDWSADDSSVVKEKLDRIARKLSFACGLSSPRDADWEDKSQPDNKTAVELLRSLMENEK